MNSNPTNATQAKERLYSQLATSLGRLTRAVGQTADLCEQLQVDLNAMRTLAALDAARFMAIGEAINGEGEYVDEDTPVVNVRAK